MRKPLFMIMLIFAVIIYSCDYEGSTIPLIKPEGKYIPQDSCEIDDNMYYDNISTISISNSDIDCLPECIGSLVRLKNLHLSTTCIADFPQSFYDLDSMETIEIWYSKFVKIPEGLSNPHYSLLS